MNTALLLAISRRRRSSGPAAPVITSYSPKGCPTVGGATVSFVGTGLTGATVTFGGDAAASYGMQTDVLCEAVCPAHADGLGDVVVTTPGGVLTVTDGFYYFTARNGYDCLYNASKPTKVVDLYGGEDITLKACGRFIDTAGGALPGGTHDPYAFESLDDGSEAGGRAAEGTITALSQPFAICDVIMTRSTADALNNRIFGTFAGPSFETQVGTSTGGLSVKAGTLQVIGPRVDNTPFSLIVSAEGASSLAWINGVLATGWPKDIGAGALATTLEFAGGWAAGFGWKGLFFYRLIVANALTATTGPMVASWLAYAVKGRGVLL